jgi:hypothetical protein
MAGGEETIDKSEYKARVGKERKSLLIQVGTMLALSAVISLIFFITLSGANAPAQ